MLLSTYEEDPEKPLGACHVMTASLDGETNLKLRKVPEDLIGKFQDQHGKTKFREMPS